MELISSEPAKLKVAVDIPSGIHSDSGAVMGIALKADVTVTFGWEKCGTVLFPGREYAGEVVIGDIGFPQLALGKVMLRNRQEANQYFAYEPKDLTMLPKRPEYSNKGTFGHVLIAAGSKNMSGAAYLSAKAAYRCGAGLVKILTVEKKGDFTAAVQKPLLRVYSPELAWEDPDRNGRFKKRNTASGQIP